MTDKHDSHALPELEPHSPFTSILKRDAFAAALLLASALAALIIANSRAAEWYHHLWHVKFGFALGHYELKQSLHIWINDGLMAIFFFVVGLEIKRELLVGELASFRKALLPAVAALGGMVCPALIYAIINWGTDSIGGWGIPMATDIAFATGCLALLGTRVHPALGVFLVALAIVDDLGAVLVIAIFYTQQIAVQPLVVGGVLVALSFGLNVFGVRHVWPYALIGVVVWWAFLQSGVHATIAGVLLAFTVPARARYETPHFSGRMGALLKKFTEAEDHVNPYQVNEQQQELIRFMQREHVLVEPPLQRLEHILHPVCVVLILPLFAFSNSGITIDFSSIGSLLLERVTLGVFFGLILGKQIGVTLCSWIAVKLGWAELPEGMTWRHVYGLSWLAGIGFTMALFISELAFKSGDPELMQRYLAESKIGVFIASFTAGIVGLLVLRFAAPPSKALQGDIA
ncbi:MAG: Na+/H+ antiporter NhaA [Candidatus Hydrogenedentes bacterium]|nr:Na+/H+ antiporter NhaA [Candidatus Hydrogenedentota bacterium]